jgi:hypothetical protein
MAATGVGGRGALAGASATGTAWPVVAAVAGLLAALLGAVVLVRSPGWPAGGRRYQAAPSAHASTDPVDEWDALTRGTDPTAAEGPDAGGTASGRTP